jgi:hypothetical protein
VVIGCDSIPISGSVDEVAKAKIRAIHPTGNFARAERAWLSPTHFLAHCRAPAVAGSPAAVVQRDASLKMLSILENFSTQPTFLSMHRF